MEKDLPKISEEVKLKFGPESDIIKEYMEEVSKIVNSKFNQKTTKEFTSKWINRQLQSPEIDDDFEEDELETLKNLSSSEVQSLLVSKEKTYSQIVKQYQLLKAEGKNEHNEMTWSLFEKPLTKAQEIDGDLLEMTKTEIEEKYPLLGFVMSIKDSIYMKDTPTTCGLFVNLDRVATRNPEMINILRNKGVVMTSKGNIPQLLFSAECGNNLYGQGMNPYDKTRTCGGSSGGEAALIALGYNNCAIGTDIGGSIRIPALFCGVAGLKPTSRRLSFQPHSTFFHRKFGSEKIPCQVNSIHDIQFVIPPTMGPLARNIHDVEKIMKVLVQDQSYDRYVHPIPWRSDMKYTKKIGVFKGISMVELGPTAKRAIDESIQALLAAKYEVIEFDIDDIFEDAVANACIAFNKNKYLRTIIYGETKIKEPLFPLYSLVKQLYSAPIFMVKFMANREKNERRKFLLDSFLKSRKIPQQELMKLRDALYYKLVERMNEQRVCALLAPGVPTPAFKLQLSNKCLLANMYTFAWNYLDMPTGVIKVCNVREDEQFYESKYNDELTKCLKLNAQDSKGMPMGISVVGRAMEEEIVVSVLKDIENNLGKIL